jgi:ribosomal protein S18 acetylase RimI-like enzyme
MTAKRKQRIDIRHAIPDDAKAMRMCAEAAYQHYKDLIGKPPAPIFADYSSLAAGENTFVAESHGKMVGMLVLVTRDDGIILDNVAVFPEYQGRGIGGKLIRFAQEEARRRGFHSIDLYTNQAMTENVAMYKYLGYVEVDRRIEDGYRRVYMQENLDDFGC